MFLEKEIEQCKRIFREIDKPENKKTGLALVATAGLEEMLKSAQQRLHLTAIAACGLGIFIGLGIGWLWFGGLVATAE